MNSTRLCRCWNRQWLKLRVCLICESRLLRLKPDSPDVLHNLAVLLTSLGKLEEAKQYLHKLLLLDEKNADVYNDLAVIEAETGNDSGAERAYTTGMKLPGATKKIYHN